MASSASFVRVVCPDCSKTSSEVGFGNFGRSPKPPCFSSNRAISLRDALTATPGWRSIFSASPPPPVAIGGEDGSDPAGDLAGLRLPPVLLLSIPVRDRPADALERR